MFKLNAVVFMLSVTQGGVNLILPPFLKAEGISVSGVGYLISLVAVGRLFSRGPGAFLYGVGFRGPALALSVLLIPATVTVLALSPPEGLIGAAIFVHGISYGLATTMLLALFMDSVKGSRKLAGLMGWYTAYSSAGNSLGSLLAGWTSDNLGMSASFTGMAVFAGIAFLLATAVSWPALADPKKPAGDSGPGKAGQKAGSLVRLLMSMPLQVYLSVGLAFYINFLNQLINTFYPLWAMQRGLALTMLGLLKSLNSIAGTGVRLFLGVILQKVGYRLLNNVCLVVLALAVSLLSTVTFIPALIGIFITLGSTRGVIRATSATYAAESAPASPGLKGMASGIYSAGLDLGNILGPTVGGITVGFVGLGPVFWIFPILLLVPCLVMLVVAGRSGSEARETGGGGQL